MFWILPRAQFRLWRFGHVNRFTGFLKTRLVSESAMLKVGASKNQGPFSAIMFMRLPPPRFSLNEGYLKLTRQIKGELPRG